MTLTRTQVESMLAFANLGTSDFPKTTVETRMEGYIQALASDWMAMEAALSPIATLLRDCPGIRVVIPSGSPMAEQIIAAAREGGK